MNHRPFNNQPIPMKERLCMFFHLDDESNSLMQVPENPVGQMFLMCSNITLSGSDYLKSELTQD